MTTPSGSISASPGPEMPPTPAVTETAANTSPAPQPPSEEEVTAMSNQLHTGEKTRVGLFTFAGDVQPASQPETSRTLESSGAVEEGEVIKPPLPTSEGYAAASTLKRGDTVEGTATLGGATPLPDVAHSSAAEAPIQPEIEVLASDISQANFIAPEPLVAQTPPSEEEPEGELESAPPSTDNEAKTDQNDTARSEISKRIEEEVDKRVADAHKEFLEESRKTGGKYPSPEEMEIVEEEIARQVLRDVLGEANADTNDALLAQYAENSIVREIQASNQRRAATMENRTNGHRYKDVRPDFQTVEEFFAQLPPKAQLVRGQLMQIIEEFRKTGDYSPETIQGLRSEIYEMGIQLRNSITDELGPENQEHALQLVKTFEGGIWLLAYGTDDIVDPDTGRLVTMIATDGREVRVDAVTYVMTTIINNPRHAPHLGRAIETLLVKQLGSKNKRDHFVNTLPEIQRNFETLLYLRYKDQAPAVGEDMRIMASALGDLEKKYKNNRLLRMLIMIMGSLVNKTLSVTENVEKVAAPV